ncbi:hypothetical protein F2P56_032135 [Juglans regia]|uniref:Uncharacterized CRM domain-containing protein At3g25440, chloroplastic isoform X1 n=2 Tax=Juglans regia TaxID=51240 RepID=A0A2I4EFS9_JUGRE|nr:uncharacterized CRM domain-containing protein At3g25440, chloroplastic isoform X1 [Juglans regia]KAF5446512.1 hypothetical protein F2P56_032135 [Juglans regia]
MAVRVLASVALSKSHPFKNRFSNAFVLTPFFSKYPLHRISSMGDVICKVFGQEQSASAHLYDVKIFSLVGHRWIHSEPSLKSADEDLEPLKQSVKNATVGGASDAKVKRKKLKGKRAVVRWLKFFRWKKKKDYGRMTADEKILYKLRKAQKKEEKLVEALKKIEPKETSETIHDPEILTPEEHFFFLKMGLKCKNYVPVGRRGIYQGVILNMHLHWKKHQTLKVVVKTFSPEEVKEIAAELARLSGGIVLNIHEDDTIIMYRGKNYSQPPTEIMSPRVTLSRKKALDKSIYRDGLRAVRKYIPKLEQDLKLLQTQGKSVTENKTDAVEGIEGTEIGSIDSKGSSNFKSKISDKLRETLDGNKECSGDDPIMDTGMASDSEDLSDIFETESETETEDKVDRPLYLDAFEKFPVESDREPEDFGMHLRQISMESKSAKSVKKDSDSTNFDEVDRIFMHAASLLKKKRR